MKKYWTAAFALVISLCVGLWWFSKTHIHFISTNNAFVDGFKVSVGPDIMARIVKLYVDEGSSIKTGDLIADLDASIPLAEKQAAEIKIAALESTIQSQQFQFKKLQNDYEKAHKEFEKETPHPQEWDQIQKDYFSAKAQLDEAQAELHSAIADLHIIETTLTHTQIFAPINGTIVKRHLWQGDVAYPGQAIFSLYDTENVWITANIEEKKIQYLKLYAPVEITIDAYPKTPFQGTIVLIKEATAGQFSLIPPDNAMGNYTKISQRIPIKISISDHPSTSQLFTGMSAKVKIKILP